MMRKNQGGRGLGTLLIFIALVGVVFSISGMGITWYYRPKIQQAIFTIIDSLDQIMANTNEGLLVLDTALEGAVDNMDVISSSLENLSTTFDNISASLESSADLIGGDLRLTIIDTQTALSSASTSAGLVDNTLRFIAAIPLLGADYRPEVPLSTSLLQVSESLDNVPDSFLEIEQDIRDTQGGMSALQTDIALLAEDIRDYEQDLFEARQILTQYEVIFTNVREQLSDLRNHTSNFLLIASILITGSFFLLGVAQINTLKLGKDYRNGERVMVSLSEIQQK